MSDGNVVGRGTPREVFYDDELLDDANLHPPSPVRIARDAGLDATTRPVTESDLVSLLAEREGVGSPVDAPGGD
jgi:cobalt/nickel transport system ATP-binding protein